VPHTVPQIKKHQNKSIMKKILSAFVLCTAPICLAAQTINISTGTDAYGNLLSIGEPDSWLANCGRVYVITPLSTYRQQARLMDCHASWVNPTSTAGKQMPGKYTYEKVISVPPGIASITFNFRVAYHDILKSVELVSPDSTSTPLTWTAVRVQQLTKPINYSLKYPKAGNWTLRVKVLYADATGGFLLCGTADMKKVESCHLQDRQCNPAFTIAPFTFNAQRFLVVNATPAVTEGATHYWGAMSAADISDTMPIRLSTIVEGRCFGLSISSSGFITPMGVDSSITGGSWGYGYQFAKVVPGICFKITHYIKCCTKWYSQTNIYCTKLCIDKKEMVPGAITAPDIPKQLLGIKETEQPLIKR
jgi:hypothetical protein